VKAVNQKYQDSVRQHGPPGPDGNPRFFPPAVFVEPAEVPDYYPPVRAGQVKADFEGNVWILPSTSSASNGGLLFDVVNRKGEVFERVQLPLGMNLIGFGPKGVVYMSPSSTLFLPAGQTTTLARATVIRPGAAVIKP
jgi:hypothetical protein